jgi:hypothetical protein
LFSPAAGAAVATPAAHSLPPAARDPPLATVRHQLAWDELDLDQGPNNVVALPES